MTILFYILCMIFGYLGSLCILPLFPLDWWNIFPIKIFKKSITLQDFFKFQPTMFLIFVVVGNLLMFIFQRFIL